MLPKQHNSFSIRSESEYFPGDTKIKCKNGFLFKPIYKKKDGPDRSVSNNQFSSVPLNAEGNRESGRSFQFPTV